MKRLMSRVTLVVVFTIACFCGASRSLHAGYAAIHKTLWHTVPDRAGYADITPAQVRAETGCRVYKNTEHFDTFIEYGDALYPIGTAIGGFGVTDIETCDFDGDGRKDLLYSFSWGSGLHRSMIAMFSFSAMRETVLNYVNLNSETALEKAGDSQFIVYDAAMADNGAGLFVNLTKHDKITEITSNTGRPAVTPVERHTRYR
jgi:hypothetical protein